MPAAKTVVTFNTWSPLLPSVEWIAIQTDSEPPYVWCTYGVHDRDLVPRLGADMLLLSKVQALRLFEFKPA